MGLFRVDDIRNPSGMSRSVESKVLLHFILVSPAQLVRGRNGADITSMLDNLDFDLSLRQCFLLLPYQMMGDSCRTLSVARIGNAASNKAGERVLSVTSYSTEADEMISISSI